MNSNTDSLLAEIVQQEGLISLNQEDIDNFKEGATRTDAIKVGGDADNLGSVIGDALATLTARNDNMPIKKCLTAIGGFPASEGVPMEIMNDVNDVFDKMDDIEIKWSLSLSDNIPEGKIEVIVGAAF